MKFFYINNAQCTECDRCIAGCPTQAIYVYDDKRYINYDKCTSCGKCMKMCTDDAVALESVGQMVLRMEKAAIYENRIRRLERELSLLNDRLDEAERNLPEAVAAIPMAAFVADRDGRVITANRAMIEMAGIDPLRLADMPANMAGESVANLLDGHAYRMFTAQGADLAARSHASVLNGRSVAVGISPLTGGTILCTVQDLSDRNVAGDELMSLLQQAIDRQMDMVQKIGALLGDEASAGIGKLNDAIEILKSSGGEPQPDRNGGAK